MEGHFDLGALFAEDEEEDAVQVHPEHRCVVHGADLGLLRFDKQIHRHANTPTRKQTDRQRLYVYEDVVEVDPEHRCVVHGHDLVLLVVG